MGEWDDEPLTFDRKSAAWGSVSAGFEGEGAGESGGEAYVELIGTQLRVAGVVDLGRFHTISDYVNIVDGYIVVRDVVVLSRIGEVSRLTMPELRVLPSEISIVGQLADDKSGGGTEGAFIEKRQERLALLTRSHIIDGDIFIQVDGSVTAFLDASDPKFIPMSNVRVRWVTDRRLAARYPSALVQRSHILGIATDGIRLGGAEETMRRIELLKAQLTGTRDADGLGGDVGRAGDAEGADRIDRASMGASEEA